MEVCVNEHRSARAHNSSGTTANGLLEEVIGLRQDIETVRRMLADSVSGAVDGHKALDCSAECQQHDRPSLYATLLGPFSISRQQRELYLGHNRATLELCRYLVGHAGQAVPRDELLELLWPDGDLARTTHRLHVVVSELRHILDDPGVDQSAISLSDDAYSIPSHAVTTDCASFDACYTAARAHLDRGDSRAAATEFRQALALYRGQYLVECPYAEWAEPPRAHYASRCLNALTFLCQQAELEEQLMAAIDYAQQILELDPLREWAHRCLMRCHHAIGQTACALRQYNICVQVLRQELGVEPSARTRNLATAIRGGAELPREDRLRTSAD